MIYQTIIIGSGPAGMMAAIELEKAGINYLLFEKNNVVGRKLSISGSNRCNVTNNLNIDDFINNLTLKNKKFLYPSLFTLSPENVVSFFKENNLELKLENDFKYFPITNKAESIINVLTSNIDLNRIKTNTEVINIEKNTNAFLLETSNGLFQTENVIIATGSKSFPKTGSTGFGLQIAKQFQIDCTDFTPAETHVYSDDIKNKYADLMGTSIPNTIVKIVGTKFKYQGDLLFTHFGLSGPVIYHLSEMIYDQSQKGTVKVEFALTSLDKEDIFGILRMKDMMILKSLEKIVTKKLAKKILEVLNIENKKNAELSEDLKNSIVSMLKHFSITVSRVEDREKAYVNKGGISLKELSPNTMETKKVEGLYFAGETINIHGPIGGYNITIAFATGKVAALSIIEKYKN